MPNDNGKRFWIIINGSTGFTHGTPWADEVSANRAIQQLALNNHGTTFILMQSMKAVTAQDLTIIDL